MYFLIKRKHIVGFAAVFLAVILVTGFYLNMVNQNTVAASTTTTNWGIGFKEEGSIPEGNMSAESLKKYDAYYAGDAAKKVIYLTFDAGFENGFTPGILDTLKKHNVKAAFFLVGHYIKTSPDLVKRMLNEGHIVGNHTYNHPDMSKIADMDSFKKEVMSLEELYKETTGKEMPRYYRPPQGKFSEFNLKQAQQLNYRTVFWSLAYMDWEQDNQPSKEQAFSKLIPRIHPGAVVLLHSTSKTNHDILDELLTKWEEMGYTFGTLDQLCM